MLACPFVRTLAVVILLGACGGSVGMPFRSPAVIPKMSELPADAQRRNDVIDGAAARPTPEQRHGQTAKERKFETRAATAAAILGMWFSKSSNVTLGAGGTFDEGSIVDSHATSSGEKKSTAPAAEPIDSKQLVPWIQLTPDAAKD